MNQAKLTLRRFFNLTFKSGTMQSKSTMDSLVFLHLLSLLPPRTVSIDIGPFLRRFFGRHEVTYGTFFDEPEPRKGIKPSCRGSYAIDDQRVR